MSHREKRSGGNVRDRQKEKKMNISDLFLCHRFKGEKTQKFMRVLGMKRLLIFFKVHHRVGEMAQAIECLIWI